jgi:hypothetical protein
MSSRFLTAQSTGGTYLVKLLRRSVFAQTEISDDQFAQLLTMPARQT